MFRGMARARTSPRQGSRPPLPPRGASAGSFEAPLRWAPWAILAGGAVVFQGALRYFFGQDDFAGLARASGVLPRMRGGWRYVSGQLYFDAMWRSAGLHAWVYHSASLAAHLGCALLLYNLLARRLSRPAALVGAIGFATHPALYTALYSISGIGEILACLFALAALRFAVAPGPWTWAAPAAFALSLLAKESTLLLPVAMAIGFGLPPRERERVRRPALACALLAAAYAVEFLRSDVFRVRGGLPENAAYALAGPLDAGRNLLTYLGWTSNLFLPTVRGVGDAVDPLVFPWGVAL